MIIEQRIFEDRDNWSGIQTNIRDLDNVLMKDKLGSKKRHIYWFIQHDVPELTPCATKVNCGAANKIKSDVALVEIKKQ